MTYDNECQACKMRVKHSRHDKNRRKQNRSHYTRPAIHVDWDKVRIKNNFGVSVIRKLIKK